MNHSYYLKRLCNICLFFSFFSSFNLSAQESVVSEKLTSDFRLHQKGDHFVNWGYNRSWFNKSDIYFSGQGHDFVLYDVVAKDRPSDLSLDYINPMKWSSPQFNFRFGYFISDKYSISIGTDHMKYVADDYQIVKMYGTIDPSVVPDPLMRKNMEKLNAKNSPNGLYDNINVEMTPADFIHYEHTDGLNYISTDIERYFELWQAVKHNKWGLTLVTGAGLGMMLPRTDSHLFGSGENHIWNIAGWGSSLKLGIQVNFTKHLYFQTDFESGYLEMIHVHTSNHYQIDRAKQYIIFYENYWQLGFRF